jgi:hypothetical protein
MREVSKTALILNGIKDQIDMNEYICHSQSNCFQMENFWMWLAWKLPKPLIYWCAIRLGVNATVDKYSYQTVSKLNFIDALERWNR